MNEVGELLCDIAEGFAPSMGWCSERCSHGGICTLEADHDGDHEAHGSNDALLCSWSTDA